MKLTRQTVKHIARLARLELSESEIERYQEQLSKILEYVDLLQEIDSTGTPVTYSVASDYGTLRPDECHPCDTCPEILANAPDLSENQVRIPPEMEGEEE